MKKTPIEPKGRFYELVDPSVACPVCLKHKFVIVQKINSLYAMHTYVAQPPSSSAFYIHSWARREDDPACLKGYKPTSHTVNRLIGFEKLYGALRNNIEVAIPIDDQGPAERILREMHLRGPIQPRHNEAMLRQREVIEAEAPPRRARLRVPQVP